MDRGEETSVEGKGTEGEMIEVEIQITVVVDERSTTSRYCTRCIPARSPESKILEPSFRWKEYRVEQRVRRFHSSANLTLTRRIGMVHIGSIGSGRINHPSDLLTRGQSVFVKVMSNAGGRLSLSMRDADQKTGADLTPHLRIKSEEELQEDARKMNERSASGSNGTVLNKRGAAGFQDDHKTSSVRRMTSPERWEIKQMIASGAASFADYPGLDEDFLSNPDGSGFNTGANGVLDADEELDIEINDAEAPFLTGQTKRALELSPVKIVKAPDGTLTRAALAGASLAKERRELKAQEAAEQADSETRDLQTPWLDPMTQSHERTFAADARGVAAGEKAKDVPAWKKESLNLATTFGKITSLSIGDQRKSLPIYKFREQLIEAFNTVCRFRLFWRIDR